MCVTSRLATSPLDREWQVLLISPRLPRISLTALAHLFIPGDGEESERKSAGDASGLLFNLAATQQSGTHLSPALKVILNRLTHIHMYPRPLIWMNCGRQPPSCLERLKRHIQSLYGEGVQHIDLAG